MRRSYRKLGQLSRPWASIFLAGFTAAYLYIFLEWLFTITKPSYLNLFSFGDQLEILFFTGSLLAGVCLLPILGLALIGQFDFWKRFKPFLLLAGSLVPAGLGAGMLLLLIDNFTYTVFKFGIVSTAGITRGLYALLFLALFGFSLKMVLDALPKISRLLENRFNQRLGLFGMLGVLLLSFGIPVIQHDMGEVQLNQGGEAVRKPHILLITGDGINARHMSVYGYERDTTPRLRELAATSLVAENAFNNSGNTGGSLVSILTSKYPAKTRVLYPPDILRGEDAFQHLPGILRTQGYYSVQLSMPHYADAYTLNMLNSFDVANGRTIATSNLLNEYSRLMPTEFAYFLYDSGNRIIDRLRHIFFLKKMDNPYETVTKEPEEFEDDIKLKDVLRLIRQTNQPLFLEVHFMGTHGPQFFQLEQVFSAGKDIHTQELWDVDFYDDSILQFDRMVGRIIDTLEEEALMDDTLIIVGSDHGQFYVTDQRIPLIMHFPNEEFTGNIRENVQNLDIAPTILDYMGIKKPDWMKGQSLISGKLPVRPIFGIALDNNEVEEVGYKVFEVTRDTKPPFFHFGGISLILCDQWYYYDLKGHYLARRGVEGSTNTCEEGDYRSDKEVFEMMIAHLQENGFDTSSLVEQKQVIFP